MKNWRDYPDGREKYHLYLASREWAVLKEAVKTRSGCVCERCHSAPGQSVHHQTYERVYGERLEDLVHLCGPCHEFVSGKRTDDPALAGPPTLMSVPIKTVYLAGKVTGSNWRDEIVEGGWSYGSGGVGHAPPGVEWSVKTQCLPLPDGRRLDLAGPYWQPGRCDLRLPQGQMESGPPHGKHLWCQDWIREDGVSVEMEKDSFVYLATLVSDAVQGSDLCFAWVDCYDCYGTLLEIGVARGAGKAVVVAWPEGFDMSDLWLAEYLAWISFGAKSAGAAWEHLWTTKEYVKSIWD